eukprot:355723-Rhodomonas_salina.2
MTCAMTEAVPSRAAACTYCPLAARIAVPDATSWLTRIRTQDALAGMGVDSPEEREQRRAMAVDRRTDYY